VPREAADGRTYESLTTAEKGTVPSGNAVLDTWPGRHLCLVQELLAKSARLKITRRKITDAETFHRRKCTNTAPGKPKTIKLQFFTHISRQDQQGRVVETCFLPHLISSFHQLLPGSRRKPAK